MRILIALSALIFVLLAAPSFAACPAPSDASFEAAAAAQLNCSSSRKLINPDGEPEFKVDLNFPTAAPDAASLPWLTIDPLTDPEAYVRALLAYGVKDNSSPSVDWRIEKNTTSQWCHAPWFQDSRERLHGMTGERGTKPFELSALQPGKWRNWAVGFYNDLGCYGIGQVWKDPAFPKTLSMSLPEGSYSIKLLFTEAPTTEVPYLTGSKEWRAAINNDGSLVTLRLLQVDVAAKDHRSINGWFFGTFIYDAYQPGNTDWEHLVPVGLMWGNDPHLTELDYEIGGLVPKEGWVNPIVAAKFFALPRHNLGLDGRLNGPVDNPLAGCVACHARALDWGRGILQNTPQDKEADALLPLAISDPFDKTQVATYFRDLGPAPYIAGTQALDYSLQLAGGLIRFRAWVLRNYPDKEASVSDVPPFHFASDVGTQMPAPPFDPAMTDLDAGPFKR